MVRNSLYGIPMESASMSQNVAYNGVTSASPAEEHNPTGASMSQNVAYSDVKIESDTDPEDRTYEVVDTVNPAYESVEGHIDTGARESMPQESKACEIVRGSEPGYSRLEQSDTLPIGVKNPLLSAREDQVQRNRQYDVPSKSKTDRYSHLEYH